MLQEIGIFGFRLRSVMSTFAGNGNNIESQYVKRMNTRSLINSPPGKLTSIYDLICFRCGI